MPLPLILDVAGPSARREVRPLAASAGLGVVGVLLDLARPWPLAMAVDYAVEGRPLGGLGPTPLLVLAAVAVLTLVALSGLVAMAALVSAEHAAERVGARLRQQLFDTAMTLSLRWHDRTRSGELMSRLTTDVGRVLDALVAICSTLLPDAVRLGLVLAVLLAFDPVLALVALAVVPVLAILAVRQRRLVRRRERDARTESGRLIGAATDLVRNVRAVQAFGRDHRSSSLFGERNRTLLEANLRAVSAEARWAPAADVVLAVGSGLVLVVGGRQVLAGTMSTGDLLVVLTYLSLLYSPVRGLSRLSGVLAKSGASAERVREVLTCRERVADRPHALPAPPIAREVRFTGVGFAYSPGRPVLADFDLTLSAGETVCLLGPSGCGKSTILHLLLRLYDVTSGIVSVDGVDVRDLERRSLRRRIAFVPQDPWLLDASIAENIAFGADGVTRHRVLRAGRDARLDDFVHGLPDGYDTVVGENAARLSGGQRRRIALARAAVSDAPLVLMDEPTASLDHASAAAVIDAIARSTAGRTVLLVTHDHDLARIADRVVVLDHLDATAARPVDALVPSERR